MNIPVELPVHQPPSVDAWLREYAAHDLFQRNDTDLALDNPYRRALPLPQGSPADSTGTDDLGALLTNDDALFANRVLLTIYERDFVLLPREGFPAKQADF